MSTFEVIKLTTCLELFKVKNETKLKNEISVVFIENIARYLKIDRPKPFEIIIPKKTNQTEEARTTSMCYGLDLDEDGGKLSFWTFYRNFVNSKFWKFFEKFYKTLAAEVMFSTHSKLYGFSDRHKIENQINQVKVERFQNCKSLSSEISDSWQNHWLGS